MTAPRPSPLAGPRLWDTTAPDYLRDIAPGLSLFAEDALEELAEVRAGSLVADVACGPGSFSFAAAKRGARVSALDFSPEMIRLLRDRAAREGVTDIEAQVGDGMALPWPDAQFDAAVSLFGLIFFPDRARGLAELRRVLRPGGRAVISSWVPAERVPVLSDAWKILGAELRDLPYSRATPVLGTPDEIARELHAAGYGEIMVSEVEHDLELPSAAEYWRSLERSTPPILAIREQVSPQQWSELSARITDRIDRRYGTGPFQMKLVALLGFGVR